VMKARVAVATCMMLMSTYALGAQTIAGLELGASKGDWNSNKGDWEENFGVRLGVETDTTRIYGAYNYVKNEIDTAPIEIQSHSATLNIEAKAESYHDMLIPFIGAHIGAIYSELETLGQSDDTTDVIYGLQAGVLIDMNQNMNLEVGYKHSKVNTDENSQNPDNLQTVYMAVNLKF